MALRVFRRVADDVSLMKVKCHTFDGSTKPTVTANPTQDVSPISLPRAKEKVPADIYAIRPIQWRRRRVSILVQNANGPCPLLALANALVLSSTNSALAEALEAREQISLGLLVDALMDELVSRNSSFEVELDDLYAFLLSLQSGMNVDPSFSAHNHFGRFVDNGEIRLYSTFGIPAVHGWLPGPQHPAFAALQRAPSYDACQSQLLQEPELESKLASVGLSEEEQVLLQDIGHIKYFLTTTAAQLTDHGLAQIRSHLPLDSFAILFRNNHFSTLLHNPAGDLVTLVTDQGYVGSDVVWERWQNSAQSDYLDGDFSQHIPQGRRGKPRRTFPGFDRRTAPDPSSQDLALERNPPLPLQADSSNDNDRQINEDSTCQTTESPSGNVLENASSSSSVPENTLNKSPPRVVGSARRAPVVRRLMPDPPAEPPPPPTYQQAAERQPYHPPQEDDVAPASTPAYETLSEQPNATPKATFMVGQGTDGVFGRIVSVSEEPRKRCLVM